MREHPIPQDITGYKFHLIGNMTLKQFAEILLGVTIAFIFFKSGLPGIIRWPAVLLFAGTGAMAAFVPIEERPLDHWIITFFKVLFKPTKFFWKRKPKIPDLFSYKPSEADEDLFSGADLSPARKQRVYEFMQSVNYNREIMDEYDQAEQNVVGQIVSEFNQVSVKNSKSEPELSKPSLKVRIRKMQNLSHHQPINTSESVGIFDATNNLHNTNATLKATISNPQPSTKTTNYESSSSPIKDDSSSTNPIVSPLKKPTSSRQQFLEPEPTTPVTTPIFNGQGQIVGTVFSANNELIANALVEVLDPSGQTIMAKQTNSLGQFVITQLPPGQYVLQPTALNNSYLPTNLTITDNSPVQLEFRPTINTSINNPS
ncbi:MAG TPA: carboxypeptidase regulatory-like domain-containing protein [Candidatus Woesebacteria bacterium]|nr:carboxypeptidase regulatory-like domain-containing protein [Candidatus Woesebacteria bacterium]